MMSAEIIIALIGIFSTVLSSWTTWFFTRKKYNSEVDQNLIQNMKESLDFYKQLSDDNRSRLEEVLKRNDELENDVKNLRNQMFNLMSQICFYLSCKLRQNVTDIRKKVQEQ